MFKRFILEQIQADAVARYPEESCGVVTETGYIAMDNVADNPEEDFELPAEATDRIIDGSALAIVHSHPDGPDHPTHQDQVRQIDCNIPWGLCLTDGKKASTPFFWGNGTPTVPILGRDFRWGPVGTDSKGDCYALIKDWYAENGFNMPEFPRDVEWLEEYPEMYRGNWEKLGFKKVDELMRGDMVYFAIQSAGIPNHAGIYLGNGVLLHHQQNRLSRREPIIDWMRKFGCGIYRPPVEIAQ